MKTEFRQSWLSGVSQRFALREVPSGNYDVLITSTSWDSRCLGITHEKRFRFGTAILILFETRDKLGLRDIHDPLLKKYCADSATVCTPLVGHSSKIDELWEQVKEQIIIACAKLGRPISIFMDISTLPRFLTGAILSLGLRNGLANSVTVFYAEATYPQTNGDFQSIFTGERWRFVPIPGLFGKYDPTKTRFYLVSIGFEGSKTLRYVSTQEPDRVSVLLADPGFEDGYVERARENNRHLIEYFHVPEEQIVRAHAGDAIAVWSELHVRNVERFKSENVHYLCCGTKPHSLGMMLRALVLKSPCVLYNIPNIHKVVNTTLSGTVWTYFLENVARLK